MRLGFHMPQLFYLVVLSHQQLFLSFLEFIYFLRLFLELLLDLFSLFIPIHQYLYPALNILEILFSTHLGTTHLSCSFLPYSCSIIALYIQISSRTLSGSFQFFGDLLRLSLGFATRTQVRLSLIFLFFFFIHDHVEGLLTLRIGLELSLSAHKIHLGFFLQIKVLIIQNYFGFAIDFVRLLGNGYDFCDFGRNSLFLGWTQETIMLDISHIIVLIF